MKGLNKENCYQLISYPSDFKERRKQGTPVVYHQQRAHATHCGGGLPKKARGGCSIGKTGITHSLWNLSCWHTNWKWQSRADAKAKDSERNTDSKNYRGVTGLCKKHRFKEVQ